MSRYQNNALSSIVQAGDLNAAATNLFRAVVQLPEKMIALLYVWQTRVDDRKTLSELADWQLKDIGVTRANTDAEASKSFLVP